MGQLTHFDLGKLIAAYGLLHFVETGTGGGQGLAHAARYTFRSLKSCEFDASFVPALTDAFRADDRIEVAASRSVPFLQRVCEQAPQDEPILFWLDAHFPGADHKTRNYGSTSDVDDRLPLKAELETIVRGRPKGRDVILVDDLRIWIDAAFGHGNLPADVRPFCPKVRDASFFGQILGATHEVVFDYAQEGFVKATPVARAPETLLNPHALHTLITAARSSPPGAFVEVGVYKGGVAWHLSRLAQEQGRQLHLFDTFAGIPEAGAHDDVHKVGDFGDTSLSAVQQAVPQATYHVGTFPDTMPGRMPPVAFVHVDCDQYGCACAVIERFLPLLVEGGSMLFDDYNATGGVRKAVDDLLGDRITITKEGKALFVKEPACVLT